MKKILCFLLLILILSSILVFYNESDSNAATSSEYDYTVYNKLIKELKADHPNWEFEIYETGLDWSDVLKAETVARHGRSLISKYDACYDVCSTCGTKEYETGWYCASTAAVAYYLDPRNSINEDYIFQFEQLTYDSTNQTEDGVKKILADCDYMQGTITYYDTNGKKQTINKTYIEVIMEAAKKYDVSPYHIASRIRQEIGTGSGSAMISGTYGSYKGYYNYFNWGAYGDDIMGSGLKTAKNYGWTTPEKAILGGVELLAKNYISIGQDTLYLQKFDVVDGGDGYYTHQYMTNISASKTEGSTVRSAYLKMGMITSDSKIKFKIPIYKNMPTTQAARPGYETIVTDDIQVTENTYVRKTASIKGTTIILAEKGTKLLRIEIALEKDSSGYYWDKVVLSDGTKGYISRAKTKELSLQSNCNTKYIILNKIAVRNGPGTSRTEIIKYISAGQIVTVVEKDKYSNLNGENWYRVKLSDGDYGYIPLGTSSNPNMVVYDVTSTEYGYVKVVCTDGLNVRSAPTVSSNNYLTTVKYGDKLFRIQKNVSTNGGYIWDKIVTESGIVGYVVRQDKSTGEAWIEPISTAYSFDDEDLIFKCIPGFTASKLDTDTYSNAVVKDGTTTIKSTDKFVTGYKITVNSKTYTAIVLGDTNCDGKASSGDYVLIKNYIMKSTGLTTTAKKLAADVNGDGKVSAADYVLIKNYIMKGTEFTI